MSKPKPKPGDAYRLSTEGPLGTDQHAIPTGTLVTVREIVKADTIGAHDDSEDAVVVEAPMPALSYDEDGKPYVGETLRAWSVGLERFDTDYTKEA